MAYCRNCGAPINDTDAYCQHCGAQNLPAGNPNYSHYQAPQDVPSTGIKVLCFLFPLIGLILYLVERLSLLHIQMCIRDSGNIEYIVCFDKTEDIVYTIHEKRIIEVVAEAFADVGCQQGESH